MRKNFVAMIVYDRYYNLEKWLHCWKQCEHHDFEFVVIHNTDEEQPKYRQVCEQYGIKYIKRQNIGYDTAPFQDICLERLEGFDNNWEKLIWVTDDWIPMSKNFVKQYVNHYQEGVVGVVCTEVNDLVKKHIRTGGFLISKDISRRLTFDVEKISSKHDCYLFEHLSSNAFYEQMINMGLSVVVVAPLDKAPIWDTEHRASLDRMEEHNNVFYSTRKVIVICPIYNSFPQIISSMITQTHQDWELYLIHDGKGDKKILDYVKLIDDPRIWYIETKERVGKYGHDIRQKYLKEINDLDGDYVLITNADNYHTPNCLETLIKGFDSLSVNATYCETMIHSYIGWKTIECRLERGYLDCACVMVRKSVACLVGWNDTETHSADWTYFEQLANHVGWHSFKKVEGCLLIHN
jgi:hypothetical protein